MSFIGLYRTEGSNVDVAQYLRDTVIMNEAHNLNMPHIKLSKNYQLWGLPKRWLQILE